MTQRPRTFDTRPLAPAFGLVVGSLDLSTVSSETIGALAPVLAEAGVLLFREQNLNDDALVRFGRLWGEIDSNPNAFAVREGAPILHFSNMKDSSGRPLGGLGRRAMDWHMDNYFRERPSLSTLYAVRLPEAGGATWFASNRVAYGLLPDPLKDEAEAWAGVYRLPADFLEKNPHEPAEVRIPLVLTTPATGAKSLYLSPRTRRIHGVGRWRGLWLRRRLLRLATRPSRIYRHAWNPGDLLIWDNAQIIHRRDGFRGSRMMKAMRILASSDVFASPVRM